jgi:hypothetical protein
MMDVTSKNLDVDFIMLVACTKYAFQPNGCMVTSILLSSIAAVTTPETVGDWTI